MNGESVSQLVVIWEYGVSPGREDEFAALYGPEGDWAKLFHEAPGYVRSDLLFDRLDPRRAFVLDWWETREAYSSFLQEYKREYEAINARAENLHSSETCLGWFMRECVGSDTRS